MWCEIAGLGHLEWLQGWQGAAAGWQLLMAKLPLGTRTAYPMIKPLISPVLVPVATSVLLPSSVLALAIAWLHPELNLRCK